MGRYEPLGAFLQAQSADRVAMTFREIEAVLGAGLPNSKRYPAWWSNNPSNNPMTKVWLAAGFVTEQVDPGGEKLVFRRLAPAGSAVRGAGGRFEGMPGLLSRLRAELGGTVRYAAGDDVTGPTGETWEAERG